MKLAIVLLFVMAAAFASPQVQPSYTIDKNQSAGVPEEDIVLDDDGHFVLRYVDAEGTMIQEEGVLEADENTGEAEVFVKMGMYTYTGDDGKLVKLTYNADDN